MFEILAKFFRFSGRENGNKFKLSMVIGLVEALASAMKIPAIMYILIGLLGGKPIGKYIGGSLAIMVIAIVIAVICKRSSTVLQTEGGYNASAFTRIKIAEHLRYLPMGYFNSNSIGEISSVTTNTMESLGDVAARVVMLTTQGILETLMIILMLLVFDWRIGLISAAGVLIFFGVNSMMQNAGKKDSEQKVVCDTELVSQIMEYLQGISEVKSYNLLGKQAKRLMMQTMRVPKSIPEWKWYLSRIIFTKRDNEDNRSRNCGMQCIFLYQWNYECGLCHWYDNLSIYALCQSGMYRKLLIPLTCGKCMCGQSKCNSGTGYDGYRWQRDTAGKL